MGMMHGIFCFNMAVFIVSTVAPSGAAEQPYSSGYFKIKFNQAGIVSLSYPGDAYSTDYIKAGEVLGHLQVRYRIGDRNWQWISTPMMAEDGRLRTAAPSKFPIEYLLTYDFASRYGWGEDVEMSERFRVEGDALIWTLQFRNLTDEPVDIGDIALPLPMNTKRTWDEVEFETQSVIRHSFISGHGSFIFWMRPNSVGPYLVMVPLAECPSFEPAVSFRPARLEYFESRQEPGYQVFVHSAVSGAMAEQRGGNWRQEHTSVTLSPRFEAGDEVIYGFKFRWADGYDGVRDVLYEEGLFDVHVVPGMTVPEDLEAMIALRTKNVIKSLAPEYPEQTQMNFIGERGKDTSVYSVRFNRRGENLLTVECGDGRTMVLEFFVAEPLEVLIKKRAAFLAEKQLIRDPGKWYDGLISDWDMKNTTLLRPDDKEEQSFDHMFGGFIRIQDFLTSGDPMLCKAPFISAKNVHFPLREEVEAVDYHLEHFVWGKLQLTDNEDDPLPYGIYGLPSWKVNRDNKGSIKPGHWDQEVSRAYDYPHYIMLYLDMHRIAKNYPGIKTGLSGEEYLVRAFGTAKAYFTLPYKRNPLEHNLWENKPTAQTTGMYNELVIVDLIEELYANGKEKEADWLKGEWEKKVEFFINDEPLLWGCEFPSCSTGFESTHAFARYALEQVGRPGATLEVEHEDAVRFMERQTKANIATRGWLEPAYYLLGGTRSGSLTYMSQMGGWSVLDYALHYSAEPEKHLRLGYASFLSSWALMNTGTPESNYGYWYPGEVNDGATASEFFSGSFGPTGYTGMQKRGGIAYGGEIDLGYEGALRTAATIVVEDPLFGLFAYGGELKRIPSGIEVIPRDGLRLRFHVIRAEQRFHARLDRDGFAKNKPITVSDDLEEIRFSLENRTGDSHKTSLELKGLPPGSYQVLLNGLPVGTLKAEKKKTLKIELQLSEEAESRVLISKRRN